MGTAQCGHVLAVLSDAIKLANERDKIFSASAHRLLARSFEHTSVSDNNVLQLKQASTEEVEAAEDKKSSPHSRQQEHPHSRRREAEKSSKQMEHSVIVYKFCLDACSG